ncbi:MFS transporter [Candidatus Methanomethylophilus sp. 1R26]|uniref:MFS transporter n=1 Tax=Candidatus Methanomethylophilus sp. 1R26 TaxID=1769296 RepID=UPI001F33031F|nr:MFS transporter [Candidatus Methanomethylophilus sp. 1R26]
MEGKNVGRLGPGAFLALIVVLAAFPPMSTDMYLPALPVMVDELGTTEAVMNMTLYGFMFSMAVSILILGPVSDKFGRKKVLVCALAEYCITTLLCSLAQGVGELIALRVLQAVGSGAAMTVSTAYVKDVYSGALRVRMLNVVAVIGVLGPLLAPIVGAGLISVWGWRSTFVAPVFVGIAAFIMVLMTDETLPPSERVEGGVRQMLRGMKELCGNRAFVVFTVMTTIFNLPFMGYLSVSSYIYEDMFGMSEAAYSLLLGFTLIMGTVFMTVINKLTGSVVNRRMLKFYLALGTVSAVAMLLVGNREWYFFLVAFIICVTVGTAIRPWGMGILMASHPGDSGAVSSLMNFIFFMIGCTGMVLSTLPWPDYAIGIGVLIAAADIAYAVLWMAFRKRLGDLAALDSTPSGRNAGRE